MKELLFAPLIWLVMYIFFYWCFIKWEDSGERIVAGIWIGLAFTMALYGVYYFVK